MNLDLRYFLQTESIYPTLFYIALKDHVFDESGKLIKDIGKLFDLHPTKIQIQAGIDVSGLCPWVKPHNDPFRHFKNQLKPKEILCALKS